MSNEILSVLQFMEKEKGIPRDEMIAAITSAIVHAAQKGVNAGQDIHVKIDPRTGSLRAWANLIIVDSVSDPNLEIHIEKAKALNPDAQIGQTLSKEIDPAYLGRIAAQTARQTIMQRIRQFEKEKLFDEYKDLIGDIVSGTVRREERGNLFVDLGKAEATLPSRERIPGEEYSNGERIRCLLLDIENSSYGPEIVLSRSHPNFVRKLFELEVSEIADGTVSIDALARKPGYKTKIAVSSKDPKVDPVGACVGNRGTRVKNIVRELFGEKVDIIRFSSDPTKMLQEAIHPATPKNVKINHQHKRIYFEVDESELFVVLGKKGFNAELTSKILGWRLDINKFQKAPVAFDQKVQRAIQGIHQIPGISDPQAQQLVANGITTPDAFEGVTASDLTDMGFSEEEAAFILKQVNNFNKA